MIAQASDPPPKVQKSVTRDSITDDASHIDRYGSVPGVVEDVVQVIDHKAERALCRRFDFRILPVLALMCTYIQLDIIFSPAHNFRPLQCPG